MVALPLLFSISFTNGILLYQYGWSTKYGVKFSCNAVQITFVQITQTRQVQIATTTTGDLKDHPMRPKNIRRLNEGF